MKLLNFVLVGVILLMGLAYVAPPAYADSDIVISENLSGDVTGLYIWSNRLVGFNVTLDAPTTIDYLSLKGFKQGQASTLRIKIRQLSGYVPSGIDLLSYDYSGTIPVNFPYGEMFKIELPNLQLDAGSYVVLITSPNATPYTQDRFHWRCASVENDLKLIYSYDSGETWGVSDSDLIFKLVGIDGEPMPPAPIIPDVPVSLRYYSPANETQDNYVYQAAVIKPAESALILMDTWETHPDADWLARTSSNISTYIIPLIAWARENQIQVVYAPHNVQISTLIPPQAGDIIVNTASESANLLATFQSRGINTLIYAGYASNMCLVFGRPLSVINTYQNYSIILARDATIAYESFDTLENETQNAIIIRLFEMLWGKTLAVSELGG